MERVELRTVTYYTGLGGHLGIGWGEKLSGGREVCVLGGHTRICLMRLVGKTVLGFSTGWLEALRAGGRRSVSYFNITGDNLISISQIDIHKIYFNLLL